MKKKGTPLTKEHIKFGRAKNLQIREKNYLKTFGSGNYSFEIIVYTKEINLVEKNVKKLVDNCRVVGVNNRKLEWLYKNKINKIELTKIIKSTLQNEINISEQ